MAREALIVTTETAYGTIKTSPVLGTDYLAFRLHEGNSCTVRRRDIHQTFRTADAANRRALRISKRYAVEGQLKCLAYVSHMPLLLKWALELVNSGQTTPWTTTIRPGMLASMTLDHFLEDSTDGTIAKKRYTGCIVKSGSLVFNNDSDVGLLTLDIVGSTATTHTQTEPALSAYPTSAYCLQDLTTIKVGSATTNIKQLSLNWTNMVKPRWDESPYVTACRLFGRNIDHVAQVLYKDSPDRRGAYEALTVQDCEYVWTAGSNTMKFDFHGTSYFDSVPAESSPLDDDFEQTLTLHSHIDPTAGTDMTLTFT
jgi:hypothetical protein